MKEKRYFISDAAKELEVESHVLRYWEEELNLDIPRNEMGHRYYREEELEMLKCVRELKERGFPLKTIRQILTELQEGRGQAAETLRAIQEEELKGVEQEREKEENNRDNIVPIRQENMESAPMLQEQKLHEFEEIMTRIVGYAMRENSQIIGDELSNHVSAKVAKEMDYLMRLHEEREEKRYQNLDHMIRQYQRGKREAAAAKMTVKPPMKKKRKSIFFQKRRKRTI